MKIVLICNNFVPITDGVGDYTFQLGKELECQGHEVNVICAAKRKIIEHKEQFKLNFVLPIIVRWNPLGYDVLIKKIKEIKPDQVIFQYVPYSYNKQGLPFYLILFFLKLRLVQVNRKMKISIFFHEVHVPIINQSKFHLVLIGLIQKILAYIFVIECHKTFTSTSYYKKKLWPINQKISVIPIGSNINGDAEKEDEIDSLKLALREKYNVVLTYFGKNPRNLGFLMEITEKVKAIENVFPLMLLIGDFDKEVVCQIKTKYKNLESNILITGYLSQHDVARYLNASDMYVAAFDQGVNLKSGSIAAAIACNLPIVGNVGRATDQLLIDTFSQSLTKSLCIHDYVDRILLLKEKKNIYDQIKENSKILYHNHLSWKAIVKNLIQVLP